MVENGVVNKVEKDLAWVMVTKSDHCVGCSACKAFGQGNYELLALNELSAKPGDHVEIEIDPKQVVSYSAIVFLLPVLGLIVGYFIGTKIVAISGLSSESSGIIGSLALMLIVFAGIARYDRILRKKQNIRARVKKILHSGNNPDYQLGAYGVNIDNLVSIIFSVFVPYSGASFFL